MCEKLTQGSSQLEENLREAVDGRAALATDLRERGQELAAAQVQQQMNVIPFLLLLQELVNFNSKMVFPPEKFLTVLRR